jgi:hypothetical protein
MKALLRGLLLFPIVFIFSFFKCAASSDLGGTLHYNYLGYDTVEIIYERYMQCAELIQINFEANIYSDCNTDTFLQVGLFPDDLKGRDVTPICKSGCDRCSDPSCTFLYGVKKTTYRGKFNISFFKCCNLTITTLFEANGNITTGASGAFIAVKAHINKCMPIHSSLHFVQQPYMLTCNNACNNVSQAATDIYGDSIRYSLDTITYYLGYKYDKQPIPYIKGYSSLSPVKTDSGAFSTCKGFNYDAGTGELKFKAVKQDYTVFAIKASQYEPDSTGKYVKIGDIGSIVTLDVIDCSKLDSPTTIPLSISGINNSPTNNVIKGCTGIPLDFSATISSGDPVDSIQIVERDSALHNMTYSLVNMNTKKARIDLEWIPPLNAIRSKPYAFDVYAKDDHCTFPHNANRRFYIYIIDSFPQVHIIKKRLSCETYTFSAPEDTAWKMQYAWQVGNQLVSTSKSFNDTFVKDGVYPLYLTLTNRSGCTKIIKDTIGVKLLPPLVASPDVSVCEGSSVVLHASGAQTYAWAPSKGLSSTFGDSVTATPDSSTTYYVAGRDIYGCMAVDTVHVKVIGSELQKQLNAGICKGDTAHFRLNTTKDYSVQWFDSNGKLLSDSSYYNQRSFKDEQLKYVITNKLYNCKKTGIAGIHIINARTTAGADESVCTGDSVQLHASGGKSYAWYANFGLLKNLDSPTPYVHTLQNRSYAVQITDSLGCITMDTVKVLVSNMTVTVDSRNDTICQGESVQLEASGGNHYEWTPSAGLSNATIANPVASPTVSTTYTVKVCDSLCGCVKHDSVHIQVDTVPEAFAGGDKKLCRGESVRLGSSAIVNIKYHWQSLPAGFISDSALVNITPDSSATYILTLSNPGTRCTSTDTARVTVYQRSKSKIYGTDSLCSGDTTYLSVNKAAGYSYHWTASGADIIGRADSNAVSISINSKTAGIAVLQTSANGCADTALKQIRSLGKPTGFTYLRSCAGSPVVFTDTAKNDRISSYSWSFGDGAKANSTTNRASHTYANAGNYLVTVTAKDLSGCSNSDSRIINIPPKPKADWSVRKVNDSTYDFGAKDSLAPTYEWEFGDDAISSRHRDMHSYGKPGTYKVRLTLLDSVGCEAKKDSSVTIDRIYYHDSTATDSTKDSVGIGPNPFINQITVDYKLSKNSTIYILLYDELGQDLFRYSETGLPPGQYKVVIPAGYHILANAMYFLKIIINDHIIVKRLVKVTG